MFVNVTLKVGLETVEDTWMSTQESAPSHLLVLSDSRPSVAHGFGLLNAVTHSYCSLNSLHFLLIKLT